MKSNIPTVVIELDRQLALRSKRPKGILVSYPTLQSLIDSGRVALARATPDFGIDYWALDGNVFVTPHPYLAADFVLPEDVPVAS